MHSLHAQVPSPHAQLMYVRDVVGNYSHPNRQRRFMSPLRPTRTPMCSKEFMVTCYHSDLPRFLPTTSNPEQTKFGHPHVIHNEKTPRLCPTFSLQVNVTAASSTIAQYIMISRYPHSSACFPPPIFNFSFVGSTDDFLHFWLACINSPLSTFCNKCRLVNIYLTSTL
jgi:hypothetical protein